MKFKGIMSRIIVSVVPVVALSIILFILIISRLLEAQINSRMEDALESMNLAIQNEFFQGSEIARSLAFYAEASNIAAIEDGGMREFLMKSLMGSKNAFGLGIWYEPYACYSDVRVSTAYAYKDAEGKAVYQTDYADTVDIYKEEWYLNGGKSKGEPIWSNVFYEPVTMTTMLTVTIPFFDAAGKMRGVSTTDISLTNIQKIVNGTSASATSKAFLLGREGEYVTFYDDSRKVTDKITGERETSLAEFGRQALRTREGLTEIKTSEGVKHAFYSEIATTGWVAVLLIDDSEIFGIIFDLILSSAVAPVIGLLIATFFLFLVASYLRKIAKKINSFAMEAANGDFSKRIDITEYDEFGALEEHLNQMMENMCFIYADSMEMNDKIDETAKQFLSLAQQTKDSVALFRTNVDGIGSSLDSLAATGDEVNLSVGMVATGAQSAAEKCSDIAVRTDSAMKTSENGMSAVRQVVKGIEEVAQDVSDSARSIRELETRTHQIQSFVSQIGGIADQTNLLALNAAIEAARAGDAGRGFAVVAEEVRKLAEDSNTAAKSIAALADTISRDLEKVVGVSQSNLAATQEVRELSIKTEETIASMIVHLRSIAEATQDLASVSQEQASSSEEIAEAVRNIADKVATTALAGENIRRGIGDIASSAESVAEGATNLSSLTDSMKATFDKFTLDSQEKDVMCIKS
ncbi:MAG: methyl-accepting chemotaxis protein [Synergistaceae bacterium]|jgi:methyl-accepting chemotaxis protein|nr:methyl-accepting chemotaxis protein [Synergistaceae bacterium]